MDGLVGRTRPLVGRSAELELLDEAARGSVRLVEVVGEPGIGKSRLLAEFASRARKRGQFVLWGRAAPFERDVPFGPIVDALDDHVDAATVQPLTEVEVRLLATVLPSLANGRRVDQVVPGMVRLRQYRAVRALLRRLARPPGVVIVLDDLHWADESTVELIDYLVRHPLPDPVVLALAYRPAQVSFRLASALADAAPGQVCRIDVGPLTLDQVHQLLGPRISRPSRERLFHASTGNPFYLDALARTEPPVDDEIPELPKAVHSALAAELAGLRPSASLVAQAAAVAGDEFEPALVATVAEVPEDAVLTAIDELVARDIVRSVGWSGRFRFRHQLVRQVSYGSAAAGWRHGAHARLASYLECVGASARARAPHVRRSAKFGDRTAIDTLITAARSAATQSPASSVVWYTAALSLLTAGEADLRVQLLQELGFCQGRSGNLAEGRETLRDVLRELPLTSQAQRAAVASFCALLDYLLGEHEAARDLLTSELSMQPDAMPLRLQLAMDSMMCGHLDGVAPLLAVAAADNDERWTIPYAALRAFAAALEGDRAAAAHHVTVAAGLLDATNDVDFLNWLPAIYPLCWVELATGRIESGLRHFTRAVELARTNGHVFLLPSLLSGQANAYLLAGRIVDGQEAVEEALEVAKPFGFRALVLGVGSAVHSWRGDHALALSFGRKSIEEADPVRKWTCALARHHLLLARLHVGDFEAGAVLVETCGGEELPDIDPFTKLNCYCLLAQSAAALGDVEQAQHWAAKVARIADRTLDPDVLFADLSSAHATSVDDPAAAAALAVRAAEAGERVGLVLYEASARLLAGTCFARAGRREQALVELRAATTIFHNCGAADLQGVAVREQRKLGVRVPTPGSRSKEQSNTLSRRELDVAELVCGGCTNQQIADKLVLSVRTVETHLTHIFAKLGVTNRAGVAGVLANQSGD